MGKHTAHEINDIFDWLTPKRRAWLYSICTAGIALLVIYGIIDGDQATGWGALFLAILQGGTAMAHLPHDNEPEE